MLKIYVNTWGNYNENGAEGGEWITLPMDSDELEETLERIADKIGDTDPEWAIHDYEWKEYHFGSINEMDSIQEWNERCDRLEGLESWDIEKLDAIIEATGRSLDEALDDLDDAIYYDGMTLEEVAEQIVDECYNLPEIALRYFDYEAFARDLRFDGYTETAHGVICIC
jgi:antirestriction protein